MYNVLMSIIKIFMLPSIFVFTVWYRHETRDSRRILGNNQVFRKEYEQRAVEIFWDNVFVMMGISTAIWFVTISTIISLI